MERPCRGKRILVVEDEYFVADDLARMLRSAGVDVVGPVPTVEDAMAVLNDNPPVDAAILDVNLRGTMVFPVAEAMASHGVPFFFATGYDASVIPPEFRHVTRFEKPMTPGHITKALSSLS